MPELPEVESTVRYLHERITGLTITGSDVHWKRSIAKTSIKNFSERLRRSTVTRVLRRGKFIWLELASATATPLHLFVHLRMSGSLDVIQASIKPDSHDRVILNLSNGKDVRFNDPRKFGRMYLVINPEEVTKKLGYEPLDTSFTPETLASIVHKKNGAIKPLLLNQSFIAGIGNIYADESLWFAKIHPLRKASSLTRVEIQALHKSIRRVLTEAITRNGTDNGDGVVAYGNYSPRAYGRDGKACKRCKTTIIRMVVGQRGTHVCPRCQRKTLLSHGVK